MIKSFRSKALKELFECGKSAKVAPSLQRRLIVRLDRLDQAEDISELNVQGFNFHALRGHNPTRYTIHINGPWCVTFEFSGGHALEVDLEQYH